MKSNKILIINRNLLYWYNELSDELDIHSPHFPPEALSQIINFGEFEIDYIDNKKVKLISKRKE